MMTVDEAIAKAEQWRKEGACGPAGLVAIALLDELERVQAQAEEDAFVIQRLGGLLHGVCLALKGPEVELQRHSYHDIVEVAQAIMLELDLFHALEPSMKAAVLTLRHKGYTYQNGEQWKPPLGERPVWLQPE